MSSCCPTSEIPKKAPFDWILWGSLSVIAVALVAYLILPFSGWVGPYKLTFFISSVVTFLKKMWWSIVVAILLVGFLDTLSSELLLKLLGSGYKSRLAQIARASLAGILLDVCSHGILAIGMQLYKKGASLGQVMAFLIASPWNSISLTLVLFVLIGIKFTLIFIFLSFVVAVITGLIFEELVQRNILPSNVFAANVTTVDLKTATYKQLFKDSYSKLDISFQGILKILLTGCKESKIVIKWLFFGIVLAAVMETFISAEHFQTYFGPSLMGLLLTTVAATIIEVCSEGATPIASHLVNISKAPGGAFTFLMAGVSTDYTEIMSLKGTTNSWKIAFFLPLLTLPQILLLGYLLNQFS